MIIDRFQWADIDGGFLVVRRTSNGRSIHVCRVNVEIMNDAGMTLPTGMKAKQVMADALCAAFASGRNGADVAPDEMPAARFDPTTAEGRAQLRTQIFDPAFRPKTNLLAIILVEELLSTLPAALDHIEALTAECDNLAGMASKQALTIEMLRVQRAEETKVWVDEAGTAWSPPTAWAYAQVCRARDQLQAERDAKAAAGLERPVACADDHPDDAPP